MVGFCLMLGACTQRMICPAYQSAFIYDKNELRKKFSYFNEDSTPKVYAASKNKYLIAEPTTYRKKTRSLQTVAMKPVQPKVPDSLQANGEKAIDESQFYMAERDIIDSTYIDPSLDSLQADSLATDSVYVISKDREVRVLRYNFPDSLKFDPQTGKYVPEKPYYYIQHIGFNTEQDNYMWYLRNDIILPDVRLAQKGGGQGADGSDMKEKKKGGFFKNLFKKKEKKKDSLVEEPVEEEPQEEEIDFNDLDNPQDTGYVEDRPNQQQVSAPPQKKGLGGLFKKKEKKVKPPKQPKTKPEEQPAKKDEADEDGF